MAVKPNLALIPSGVKASTVYSVLPSDGVGDFDFSRSGSATRINKDGLIETVASNVPRLNYPLIDGVVQGCPSLLLEPSRTNLIPQSETFLAGWSKINGVVVSDEKEISPDGTLNASKLVFDGTNNGRIERAISGLTQGADYTVSVYARVASGTQEVIFGSFEEAPFTLTTEWQRLTRTQAENDTVAYPRLRCNDAATIEIYGFQLEQGYPTSYIKTQGSIVTRLADSCNQTPPSGIIGQTEGTVYFELNNVKDKDIPEISIDDNSNNNRIVVYREAINKYWGIFTSSSGSGSLTNSTTTGDNGKFAISYSSSNFSLYRNGVEIVTHSGSLPISLTNIRLNGRATNDQYGSKEYSNLKIYNTRLSNSELQALTS